MATTIWWVRRDLRVHDNPALAKAASRGPVIPLFILDPTLLNSSYAGERRIAFMLAGLRQLEGVLAARGGRLIVRSGDPAQVLAQVMEEGGADVVYAAADVSPYASRRDARVAARLPLELLPGLTARPPGDVLKPDGTPYVVFTPYKRAWLAAGPLDAALSAPARLATPAPIASDGLPSEPRPDDAGDFPAGERQALARLEQFTLGARAGIASYADSRDLLALDGTARLSPYLRFGMLSPRRTAQAALDAGSTPNPAGAETWLSELIWREFYFSILHHFPRVRRGSFRPEYDAIQWIDDPAAFQAWCDGRTGYPVVDAGMRQLLATGWMHNRARMLCASFLVKDLLIDWRRGERWFMQHLLDGDPAPNNGGWQWAAGTGTDAAPYFRIFNPTLQGKRFDPQGEYIRRWVPELRDLAPNEIHEPWRLRPARQAQLGFHPGTTYPLPIVEHAFARQRALEAYRRARG